MYPLEWRIAIPASLMRVDIFLTTVYIFSYIWPLALPNIAEKGAAIVEKLKFQAVIKWAASAASPTAWDLQRINRARSDPVVCMLSRGPDTPGQIPGRRGRLR